MFVAASGADAAGVLSHRACLSLYPALMTRSGLINGLAWILRKVKPRRSFRRPTGGAPVCASPHRERACPEEPQATNGPRRSDSFPRLRGKEGMGVRAPSAPSPQPSPTSWARGQTRAARAREGKASASCSDATYEMTSRLRRTRPSGRVDVATFFGWVSCNPPGGPGVCARGLDLCLPTMKWYRPFKSTPALLARAACASRLAIAGGRAF